jgi:predicted metal-dependent hydrolase
MAVKKTEVPGIGTVKLYKRKGSRALRLTVSLAGEVRVSIPYWLPYDAGARFASTKVDWIQAQLRERTTTVLIDGQAIGKSHHMNFVSDSAVSRITARVQGQQIRITHPDYILFNDPEVQVIAERAAIRALRVQAERLLPQRLQTLAAVHGFTYKSSAVKRLTSRWGSCDNETNIILNLYLIQLPWELIDYVVIHELTHTRALNHGPDFWNEFEKHLPEAKKLRRQIKQYRPVIGT